MWRSNKTKIQLFEALDNVKEFIVFDTETTGFSAEKNHIIQISGIKFTIDTSTCNIVEVDRLNTYINPGYSLPPKIIEVTGITDEMLVDKPYEEQAFYDCIYPFFGENPECVIAYNTPFDIRFMKALYERYNKTFEPKYQLDVLEMARDLVEKSDSKKHNLESIATLYGVNDGISFHCSMDDVIATLRLFRVFIDEYKKNDGEQNESNIKKVPKISSMHYWKGYRGCSRIYIHTNMGAFYYDIMSKKWNKKNDNLHELNEVDMERLRDDAFKLANAANELEFSRYRG